MQEKWDITPEQLTLLLWMQGEVPNYLILKDASFPFWRNFPKFNATKKLDAKKLGDTYR